MGIKQENYKPSDAFRHIMARWEAETEADRIAENHLKEMEQKANLLLKASITLIPSDFLQDNEFVVSRNIYEAAKRVVAGETGADLF